MHEDTWIAELCARVLPADAAAMVEARERQDRLTKPRGALGEIEDVSVRLCGVAGRCPSPGPARPAVAVFAGDHGVHAQGVSPWPQEVTSQMVGNFITGGAAVSVLARQVGARVLVVDVGVATRLDPADGFLDRKVRAGTADLSAGPAMSRAEALAALRAGAEVADLLADAGHDVLLTGDMGIANTTPSAALIAAFTGAAAGEVTGRGTGIDDATWAHKVEVVQRALDLHLPQADPMVVAAALGGLEHLAIAGFLLAAAARRVPVILDGVIAGSAALIAHALAPDVVDACIAGHRSAEPGHRVALERLGLRPLIDLGLRLGEGTGALLALPVVQAAAATLGEMATFDAAGVTDKGEPPVR